MYLCMRSKSQSASIVLLNVSLIVPCQPRIIREKRDCKNSVILPVKRAHSQTDTKKDQPGRHLPCQSHPWKEFTKETGVSF